MDTTELDTLTDNLCKTDSTSFPTSEKLTYYNIAKDILSALIIDEQEDYFEEEYTKDTAADRHDYMQKARIHHINWLKIYYDNGFIPARYKSEAELVSEYGTELETVLENWDSNDPIYNYKGKHLFIYPAVTSDQAGSDRLKASIETYPEDIEDGDTPDLPENTHQGLSAYASMQFLEEDDPLWKKAKRMWDEVVQIIQNTTFPRAKQANINSGVPEDDGSNY